MRVVSDASPIIALARIGCLGFLNQVYGRVHIAREVYEEVVIAGSGLPGADLISVADWIEVATVHSRSLLSREIERTRLAAGEVSTVILAKELGADPVLI
ncbi:MAG: hypothetical protein JO062_26970 [Bryobacterales bacterium]|nr:hypothetical protein [Bryobacterales bacterium]